MTQSTPEPEPRGERVARFVEAHLAAYPSLSLGELAARSGIDIRDLQRLLRDRSCGWRLEDKLAAYFGDAYVEAVFRPVVGSGPSRRERELAAELSDLADRRQRIEQARAERQATQGRPVEDANETR